MRLIRAVSELNSGSDDPLVTIALYTDSDSRALFVREADEAYSLGSATYTDDQGNRKNRYVDYQALERALRESRAEAVWLGWGFVSEHAEFAELCRDLGIVFIGPTPEVMRRLGDKIGSKLLAEEAGVPVAPWSGGPVADSAAAVDVAERLGYPLMVKATAGGGGRGIRRVLDASQLADAFASASSEALKGFGNGTVFLEKLMGAARHIEVQIIGDEHGTVWALGVRDCSVQRRNQKVIEESPSPALSEAQHAEICAAARRLGERSGYHNAGTVEFLYDPATESFSFMEVNARLQVEHPVTELTTGVDLVKLQIAVAQGEALVGEPPTPRGHAVEVRVNAEDPEQGFLPTPGRVELFQLPGGAGIRVDTGFVEGASIAPEFDSMIAKVIAVGRDRSEAMARLRRALQEMRIGIRGGTSNKGFLIGLLGRPEVVASDYDIGWLDRLTQEGRHMISEHPEVGLLYAAVLAYQTEFELEMRQFYSTAARGRMLLRREVAYEFDLRHRGTSYRCRVQCTGPRRYRVTVDGVSLDLSVEPFGAHQCQLRMAGRRYQALSLNDYQQQLVEIDGCPHRFSRDDAGLVRAPAPAVVLSFGVSEGQAIRKGDLLVTLEAMKTELPVLSPCDGRVRKLLASPNVQVDTGAPLAVIEPEAEAAETGSVQRLDFAALADAGRGQSTVDWHSVIEQMMQLAQGFDIAPAEAEALIKAHHELDGAGYDAGVRSAEDRLLSLFVDIAELFGHRGDDTGANAIEARTPEEYLLLYLRSLEGGEGISERFLQSLQRTLRHYGIHDLERTPELEEALVWICKAHQRMDIQVRVVLEILERRLELQQQVGDDLGEEFRRLLGRIMVATRRSYPALSDLAHELRYRFYHWPFFREIWQQASDQVDRCLKSLEAGEGDEVALMEQLVANPQPLMRHFTQRCAGASSELRAIMLEALSRRHYRERDLRNFSRIAEAGVSYSRCEYAYEGRQIHLVSCFSSRAELPQALAGLNRLARDVPPDWEVVFDCFLAESAGDPDHDALSAELAEAVNAADLAPVIRALVIGMDSPEIRLGIRANLYFTFRQGDSGYLEDRLVRGLHPIMSKRLELWRLEHFDIERLPSSDGVFLFRGVARSNPKDERLFAFAEIRDLTPIRDDSGKVERVPHLEMMAMETLAAIRLFQSHRSVRQRLQWNRIFLYAWPPIDFTRVELNEAAHQLGEVIEDLGLEKVLVRGRLRQPDGSLRDRVIEALTPGGREVVLNYREPATEPLRPLDEYARKVVQLRQRGLLYPYEIIRTLTSAPAVGQGEFPPGAFQEYDLDDRGELVPVERPPGQNRSGIIVGRIEHRTEKYPEGMQRMLLMGDPTRGMGSLAEAECRRINAALDLAYANAIPVEWFALSAGALIAMDSGTENLDWTARVLRRIIEFTQDGGEINVIVHGVNVGAQSYWNAEATMLMHTRGILVMTVDGAMLLTGKKALDYSGAVSAEDNQGIGGYDRIMGVNGQAQYWAEDVWEACQLLLRYYDHAYVLPGERFPRQASTDDPSDRDVSTFPHGRDGGCDFDTVGEIFRNDSNPGRHKPFDIRKVMSAVVDRDLSPLERWRDLREGETAVVWDAHLGGYPVCLLGMESHPVTRLGFVPMDGPGTWSSGTLFPLSSKKIARAINAASGNRPVVVLANLSGFDGSPESMRRLQLEYGAEIGRAVVNFRGPMVFCGICRYHGGAYVVFSSALNEGLETAALDGSYASVIGGKPAAAVVFASEVRRRTLEDPRLQQLDRELRAADDGRRSRLHTRWHELHEAIHSEKLGEVAAEFDQIHSVHRAKDVGSLHHVVPPEQLRPYLIDAVERGIHRALAQHRATDA
jgi:acetyl/propionyl-CoA carboxylase alpha subunit/acetyl-CoA carboxylase carboxyltransferase component